LAERDKSGGRTRLMVVYIDGANGDSTVKKVQILYTVVVAHLQLVLPTALRALDD
jgi:hypothetical protein